MADIGGVPQRGGADGSKRRAFSDRELDAQSVPRERGHPELNEVENLPYVFARLPAIAPGDRSSTDARRRPREVARQLRPDTGDHRTEGTAKVTPCKRLRRLTGTSFVMLDADGSTDPRRSAFRGGLCQARIS